jgi:hypothetical protein
MIVYQTDHLGYYVGEAIADPSPMEPGKYLIPAGCVTLRPPGAPSPGKVWRWSQTVWNEVDDPSIPAPPPPPTPEQQRKFMQLSRANAYRMEADPLAFKMLRGEATQQEWEVKIAEIRARYPYPDGVE